MAEEPLFYNEYEQFYGMTSKSKAFEKFCKDAFGDDFSQDGFSDLNQINRILKYMNANLEADEDHADFEFFDSVREVARLVSEMAITKRR